MGPFSSRHAAIACVALATSLAATVASNEAAACGGCFHPENARSTVVTAHRMALSISPTQTVLWDQVRYDGSPTEFAWVLPVKPGARIEVATDAWFETLDATTSTQVAAPPMNCNPGGGDDDFGGPGSYEDGGYYGDGYYEDGGGSSGCNCMCGSSDEAAADGDGGYEGPSGAGGTGTSSGFFGTGGGGDEYEPPPPVTVVHEGTVGPYETVTLHANEEGALPTWLTEHGYAIDADIQPIIDAYADEGFDFIALRLAPDQGVQQMKPVRVISPGAVPTLPLRMVSAGTGANVAITLFVVGEGRWEPANFPGKSLDPTQLVWDFNNASSNYAVLRAGMLDENDGRTWLTSYARQGSLLSGLTVANPLGGTVPLEYRVEDGTLVHTIAEAYFAQGWVTGEAALVDPPFACIESALAHASSMSLVVDACQPAGGGGSGGSGGAGGASVGGAGGSGGMAGSGGMVASGGSGGAAEDCTPVSADQIDSRDFGCGALDDLSVAMTGMHPRDVWVTRLESDLPRAALATDLDVQAALPQEEVEHFHTPTKGENNPCPIVGQGAAAFRPARKPPTRKSREPAMLLGIAAALALAALRRASRGARGADNLPATA